MVGKTEILRCFKSPLLNNPVNLVMQVAPASNVYIQQLHPISPPYPQSCPPPTHLQVAMVSPITQAQVTFPVRLARPSAREELMWLSTLCRALETRLLQVGGFAS